MNVPMPSKLQLLAVPLVLAALLLGVSSAHAMPIGPTAVPLAFEEEACEEAKEEFEEGELSRAEVKEYCDEPAAEHKKKTAGPGSVAPEECILRSAHGHAAISSNGDKLKLTVGYTTYEPVTAKIDVGKGTTLYRHLGRSGVLRITESLQGDNAPKQLAIRIQLPSARSAGCPFRRLVLFPR